MNKKTLYENEILRKTLYCLFFFSNLKKFNTESVVKYETYELFSLEVLMDSHFPTYFKPHKDNLVRTERGKNPLCGLFPF